MRKKSAERHHIWFGMFNPRNSTSSSRRIGQDPAPSSQIFSPLNRVLEGAHFDETVSEMLYLDFRLYLQDNLLVKVDRASMACSLELRTPFLDHRLIELPKGCRVSSRCALSAQIHPEKGRGALAAARNRLPAKARILRSIASWMRNELRPLLDETLGKKSCAGRYVQRRVVRRLLNEHWSARPITAKRCGRYSVFNFGLTGGRNNRTIGSSKHRSLVNWQLGHLKSLGGPIINQ